MSTTAIASPLRAIPAVSRRYTVTAQALHWVTALLMFAVIPLAWVMVALPDGAPNQGTLYDLHKSIGVTIVVLVAIRLAWRAAHPAPPGPASLVRWERAAARASHWLLYLILVGMPVSGYVMSSAGGHAVTWFGLFALPALPHSKAAASTAYAVHVAIGQWATYALIVLHLLATAWHVAIRRDAVLARMLPPENETIG